MLCMVIFGREPNFSLAGVQTWQGSKLELIVKKLLRRLGACLPGVWTDLRALPNVSLTTAKFLLQKTFA